MIEQIEFTLPAMKRGCNLITDEITARLRGRMPVTGILNVFVKHTSCGLTINENFDADVRSDMAHVLDHLVRENEPYYAHTSEGADDMPAHAKCSLIGTSVNIPVSRGRLNLGTWQGIYLCEFRNYGGPRHIVLTIIG